MLQDAERMAVEKNVRYKSSVERLAEGLKASSAVLVNDDSLQVGGVRVKRKKS